MHRAVCLLLATTAASCAGARAEERPLELPTRAQAQSHGGHQQHDCVADAEQTWAERQRSFERVPEDANALAAPAPSAHQAPPSASDWFAEYGAQRTDLTLTARIRAALLADASLSFAAKNVKILSRDGKVSLRGAIPSARERSAVRAIADRIAGAGNVEAQL